MSEKGGLVREALRRERGAVRAALAAGLLVTLCTVGLATTSAWLIVRAAQRPSVLSLTVPMGLVQLFALAKAAGRYLERTQTHRAALSAMGHVRAEVAGDLEPLLPAGLGPRSADVVDAVLGDVERVQDLLTAVAGPLLTSAAAAVVSAVVCGLLSSACGLVLLGALVVDAVLLPWVALRAGASSATQTDVVHAQMTALFDQAAQSGDEFVMVGAGTTLRRRLEELEDRADAANARRRDVAGAIAGLAVLVNAGACVTVTVVSVDALRAGHMGAALIAVPALTTMAALELVSGMVTSVVGAARDRAALRRLHALRERPWPVHEPREACELVVDEKVPGLTMTNVSQSYGGIAVLNDVDLTLRAGDAVVLEGPSGGGKTTLVRILAKFLDPASGTVILGDSTYSTLASTSVRGVVGIVDDAPHVFNTTLADNLRVARRDATDDELLRACETAGLNDFVAGLPDGLATRLGGTGTGLSGGEQRRLGVARELVSGRPVAIFDEPTEGLDERGATALITALREHYREGILVIVSHQDARRVPGARLWRLVAGTLREVEGTTRRESLV